MCYYVKNLLVTCFQINVSHKMFFFSDEVTLKKIRTSWYPPFYRQQQERQQQQKQKKKPVSFHLLLPPVSNPAPLLVRLRSAKTLSLFWKTINIASLFFFLIQAALSSTFEAETSQDIFVIFGKVLLTIPTVNKTSVLRRTIGLHLWIANFQPFEARCFLYCLLILLCVHST